MMSGRLIPPAPFFFLKTTLAIQGLLCFHMNCEIFHSSSVKNAIGDLIGITLTVDCKLLDGTDWPWEKLGLTLVGKALLSKALIQVSAGAWGCTSSLVVVWPEATQPWGLWALR